MEFKDFNLENVDLHFSTSKLELSSEGALIIRGKLYPRGIVALDINNMKCFCIDAKVRNFESKNLIKLILKGFFAAEKLGYITKEALISKGVENARLINLFRPVLNSQILFALNKEKEMIKNSIVKVYSGEKLSTKFKCNKKSQIYTEYVEKAGNDFTTPEVVLGLNLVVDEVVTLWDLKRDFDTLIGKLADENEKAENGEIRKAELNENGKRKFYNNALISFEKAQKKCIKLHDITASAEEAAAAAAENYKTAAAAEKTAAAAVETAAAEEKAAAAKVLAAAAEEKAAAAKAAEEKAEVTRAAVKACKTAFAKVEEFKKILTEKAAAAKTAAKTENEFKTILSEKAAAVKAAANELKAAEEYTAKCKVIYA